MLREIREPQIRHELGHEGLRIRPEPAGAKVGRQTGWRTRNGENAPAKPCPRFEERKASSLSIQAFRQAKATQTATNNCRFEHQSSSPVLALQRACKNRAKPIPVAAIAHLAKPRLRRRAHGTPTGTKIDPHFAAQQTRRVAVKVAQAFVNCAIEELKALLDGGSLTVYSVARPHTADTPVSRSGILAVFTFAAPAFGPVSGELEQPLFASNPVMANSVGTPGFARACTADGSVVADFSAGPGDREVKFSEVSCSHGAPVTITQFKFMPEGSWPEKIEYYEARPRSGYALPST
jgi:hypothetical protein